MRRNLILPAALLLVLLLGAACAQPTATPMPPTKTPKPTFTFTPNVTPTPLVIPTATPLPATATPRATATPVQPTATPVPPSPTPLPAPKLTANQSVNVRRGPGTNYAIVGSLDAGQSFDVIGKNPAGDWYQFSFQGQTAWVNSGFVGISGDSSKVLVAQNIPAPPPPPPTARPQPTAAPQPTPLPRKEFNIALVQRCDPQEAGNYIAGTVYKNGQPLNGKWVVFSVSPDGNWATDPQTSGPHQGYEPWNTGYYSHIG